MTRLVAIVKKGGIMATKKKVRSIAIDEKLLDELDRLADAQGISTSALISKLCREGLENEGMMVAAFTNPLIRDSLMKAFGQPDVIRAMASSMSQQVDPRQLELFQQGLQMLNNYGDEWRDSLSPEVVAEKSMKRTIRQNKAAGMKAVKARAGKVKR